MADLDRWREVAEAGQYLAVLAVAGPDGHVHASVVSAGVLDDPVSGRPSVAAVLAGGAKKLAILRRSGRAAMVVRDGFRWSAAEGPARLFGPDEPPVAGAPDLPPLLRAIFAAAGGSHEDWDEFDRVMAAERRVALFVEPETVTGVG